MHVFCAKSASTVIKSYAPELIVHPYINEDREVYEGHILSSNASPDVTGIQPWINRLHGVVVCPLTQGNFF